MSWPMDVGILSAELYFPYSYVDQDDLETYDRVSKGKYTVGLGQKRMGFCTDSEDVNSLALTVLQRLIERRNLDLRKIGRLDVGTESSVDKSKSVKSVLMQLFEQSGNFDVEGVDCINACFGGTQALFNALNWVESTSWDGRLAIVVMTDVASYPEGPARCTGGAGALALLIGPNAPLVFDRGLRAVHMRHCYDFYKPNPNSEYPIVDGKLSVETYLSSLDKCFTLYREKVSRKSGTDPLLESFAGIVFHTPYCKLVQKSLARLKYLELVTRPEIISNNEAVDEFRRMKISENDSYTDKSLEKVFMEYSRPLFNNVTAPSLYIAENVGNMYTPSLYAGLISLLINKPLTKLAGQSILLFSYGSGSCSAMFSLQISPDSSPSSPLAKLVESLREVKDRMESRGKVSPERFAEALQVRQNSYGKAPYQPSHRIDQLFPNTFYLKQIDEKSRRIYARKQSPPVKDYFMDGDHASPKRF